MTPNNDMKRNDDGAKHDMMCKDDVQRWCGMLLYDDDAAQ